MNFTTPGKPWGATPEDWQHFVRTLGLQTDVLPVVSNPNATISPRSKMRDLGKTPSRYDANDEVVGLPRWTAQQSTERDVQRWSAHSDLGICLQTRRVRAIDIDIADPVRAAEVEELIGFLAALPARRRANSGKCLLAFTMPGAFAKRVIKTAHGIIEFLATGQQFIAVGTHPSGARYEWGGGLPADVPELTPAEFEMLWRGLVDAFAIPDGASEARPGMAPTAPRRASDVDDPIFAWLEQNGQVTGEDSDGKLHVMCPWGSGHSTDSGPSSTTWLPAGTSGFEQGHFKCLHASCARRRDDEYLAAVGHTRSMFEVVIQSAKDSAAAARVSLSDFYAHAPDHKYIYTPTQDLWPAASVDGMVNPWPEANGKPLQPSKYLDRTRAVQGMTWAPGEPKLIEDRIVLASGFADHAGARIYNRYMPPAPFVGDPTLAGPWLDHLKALYPDDWSHLLHWFAHRVQRPGEKVNHALVLGGTQGIGKDSILVPVKVGVGASNVQDVSPGALLGAFNSFVAAVLLVVSEARDLGDTDRFKLYEHSKTLTAAPPDVLRVNEKHLREFYVPNLVGVIFTTNHRTSGLYLPAEDRRHYVAWSELQPAQLGDAHFKALYSWYAGGGIGHVLAYLHALDLSAFNPKAEPRKTDAFWALVQAGESPESNELRDAIKACGAPPAITVRTVRDAAITLGLTDLALQLQDPRERKRLPHMLERVGYVAIRNPDSKTDGRFGKDTVYAVAGLDRSLQISAARGIAAATRAQKSAGSTATEFA